MISFRFSPTVAKLYTHFVITVQMRVDERLFEAKRRLVLSDLNGNWEAC